MLHEDDDDERLEVLIQKTDYNGFNLKSVVNLFHSDELSEGNAFTLHLFYTFTAHFLDFTLLEFTLHVLYNTYVYFIIALVYNTLTIFYLLHIYLALIYLELHLLYIYFI